MPENHSENQPILSDVEYQATNLLQPSSPNGDVTPEDDAIINRQFFHPFLPPDLSGIVKRSDLLSARRQNLPIPFELALNWPPIGWESDDCPIDDSLDRLRQWFTFLVGPNGVVRISECFAKSDMGWQATCGSVYVRDTWRLIEHLKEKGTISVPYQEETREYTVHEAFVEITRLKEQVFSISPNTTTNENKADKGEDRQLDKPVPTDQSKAETEKTTRSACEDRWVFAPDGDGYFISAFGVTGHFGSLKGFEYIAKLIASPGRNLAMVDLQSSEDKAQQSLAQFSKQPVLDQESKANMWDELASLDANLDKAKNANDIGEIERLTQEKESMQESLFAALGCGGRDRDMNNLVDNMRSNIHSALKTAFKRLQNGQPSMNQLAQHLKTSISAEGPTFIYNPSPLLLWLFEKQGL